MQKALIFILDFALQAIRRWVDREKLYGFSGRSRGPQFDLAKKFNFQEYA